ncbi:MAG: LPXTG cell wall anchor domain-containing protein [Clostridia bacterium]|nr:LPXTG cell wall anchor domain-containing protein [Clostridia bacterium]
MKKLAVLFVAVMLVVAMTVPSLAAVSMAIKTPVETPPTRYLHLTAGSEQSEAQLTVKIDGSKLTVGETYTVSVTMKFENITGSNHAYTSIYNYTTDSFPYDFTGLDYSNWGDFAVCNASQSNADWQVYTSTFPVDKEYACSTISFGFYLCSGTIYISEISLKDSQGNVVFADDFSNGLDTDLWKEYAGPDNKENYTEEKFKLETVQLHGYTAPEPETSEPEAPVTPDEPANPETGDSFVAFAVMAVIALAGASAVVVRSRKN